MDLQQLRALTVLSEEAQFSRAAIRLGISQPALSQKLQRIEAELGFTIFTRAHRQIRVTPAGQEILRHAQEILAQWEAATRRAQRIARGDEGFLKVGFIENASFHLLPATTSRLRKRYPSAHLDLIEMISPDMPAALTRHQIDVAVMRPIEHDFLIESLVVMAEPYYVALPDGHALAEQDHVSLHDLADLTLIAAPGRKANYLRGQFSDGFAKFSRRFEIGQEVEQLPAIIALVAAGIGYTLLPESATGLSIPGVIYRRLDPRDDPQATLAIGWRAGDENPLLKAFISSARAREITGRPVSERRTG